MKTFSLYRWPNQSFKLDCISQPSDKYHKICNPCHINERTWFVLT